MAPAGQGATQAPQPVHAPGSTKGCAGPPTRSFMMMARGSHASVQTRHSTPHIARQAFPIAGVSAQALRGLPFDRSTRSIAPSGQTLAQTPQKMQVPRLKSTSGKPERPWMMIFSGQALTQSLQRLHASMNSDSGLDHGGRTTGLLPAKLPRRKDALLIRMFRLGNRRIRSSREHGYGPYRTLPPAHCRQTCPIKGRASLIFVNFYGRQTGPCRGL